MVRKLVVFGFAVLLSGTLIEAHAGELGSVGVSVLQTNDDEDALKTKRIIKRRDEEFVVERLGPVDVTVTDEQGVIVRIRYQDGRYETRLLDGWGGLQNTMDAAVDYAVQLCFQFRGRLTQEDMAKEIEEYLQGEDEKN